MIKCDGDEIIFQCWNEKYQQYFIAVFVKKN